MRTAARDQVQRRDDVGHRVAVGQVKPGPDDGRPQRRQHPLERGAHRGGEPLRGLHNEIEQERATAQPQLGLLALEVGDRLVHLPDRAGPYAPALVENAVDRRFAQPRLQGDVADPIRVGSPLLLMAF